jgi:hypothetical protein
LIELNQLAAVVFDDKRKTTEIDVEPFVLLGQLRRLARVRLRMRRMSLFRWRCSFSGAIADDNASELGLTMFDPLRSVYDSSASLSIDFGQPACYFTPINREYLIL